MFKSSHPRHVTVVLYATTRREQPLATQWTDPHRIFEGAGDMLRLTKRVSSLSQADALPTPSPSCIETAAAVSAQQYETRRDTKRALRHDNMVKTSFLAKSSHFPHTETAGGGPWRKRLVSASGSRGLNAEGNAPPILSRSP